jgi:hypothetical protein
MLLPRWGGTEALLLLVASSIDGAAAASASVAA